MTAFTADDIPGFLKQVFAPWVQDLGLEYRDRQGDRVTFRLPENARLVRQVPDGAAILCGQALGAAADTASVLALTLINGRLRNMTTTDFTVHFLRPLPLGDVDLGVQAVSNGRRLAVTRVEFRSAGADRLAAVATCSFAYLE